MAIPTGFPKVMALVRATSTSKLFIYVDENGEIPSKTKSQLIDELHDKYGADNYLVYEAVQIIQQSPRPIT